MNTISSTAELVQKYPNSTAVRFLQGSTQNSPHFDLSDLVNQLHDDYGNGSISACGVLEVDSVAKYIIGRRETTPDMRHQLIAAKVGDPVMVYDTLPSMQSVPRFALRPDKSGIVAAAPTLHFGTERAGVSVKVGYADRNDQVHISGGGVVVGASEIGQAFRASLPVDQRALYPDSAALVRARLQNIAVVHGLGETVRTELGRDRRYTSELSHLVSIAIGLLGRDVYTERQLDDLCGIRDALFAILPQVANRLQVSEIKPSRSPTTGTWRPPDARTPRITRRRDDIQAGDRRILAPRDSEARLLRFVGDMVHIDYVT